MVLFSLEKLIKRARGREGDFVKFLYYITYRPLPKNKKDPFYQASRLDWGGDDFLINPEGIFSLRKSEFKKHELVEYVELAGLRSLAEYLTFGTITLDLLKSPLHKDIINNNRFLTIEDGQIHFYFEEILRRK